MSSDTESTAPDTDSNSDESHNKDKSKTVEEKYRKVDPREHILLRPDTYVGSIEQHEDDMFIVDPDQENRIIKRRITYTPALLKIFDEILVNAADNKQRHDTMDRLDVTIDADANRITVRNNGKGVPVQKHKGQGVYVPTMIFGQLLTGSNFDDDEKKTTGGRNGYGAKLANVYSTEFVVECVDVETGKYFRQVFADNMMVANEPDVEDLTASQKKKGDYVEISFCPDLRRFKMTQLDKDMIGLFSRRAYDVAASLTFMPGKKLTVTLNGRKLPIRKFEDYIKLHEGINKPVAFHDKDKNWEVGVALAEDGHDSISFVNSIATTKGGKHVEYIVDQISNHLIEFLRKKKIDVTRSYVKNHLFVFVNCLIENPSFDSQTKECLTTKPKNFGSPCKLAENFLKKVEKSEIKEAIVHFQQMKDQKKLKGTGGKKRAKITGIPKLDDANNAGTAKSKNCTLIITEGDSAKTLAMAGLSVIGRDYYGVFPLRGKPLNVRDASNKQVTENEEIKNLVTILGLKFDTEYDESNIKTLRYGHLVIMADQDTDGSHIKGLTISFIHHFWPTLLDVPGFLQQFITPIVKVSKDKSLVKTFFNVPEYEKWLESTGNNGKGWKIKYYKGLGTSTSAEAKEYFSNPDLHLVKFMNLSSDKKLESEDELDNVTPDTTQSGADIIDMLFNKKRVRDRKNWLESTPVTGETYMDYTAEDVKKSGARYSDFFNKEFLLFSAYDNMRSIPHIIDGFKPSQRKVLYGCCKRKLKSEVKVAQLTGYIAEHSSYHHGEASLQGTIVAMASSFLGSNNVNLLTPAGQFGTRRMGGKDAASARYIFTKLEDVTRTIFHPDDDALLNYLNDDGTTVEPDFYVPVIPMVLVNGAEGIGSGWATTIPNHNPRDIIANIRRMISGEDVQPMCPHFHGFAGKITKSSSKEGTYDVTGRIERVDDTTLVITELPIRTWTQGYKEQLELMMTGTDKQPVMIQDFKENHTETEVHFTITATKENIDEWEQQPGGLVKQFKLTSVLKTTNMVAFYEGKITKFKTAEDILRIFFDVRQAFYIKRKTLLVKRLKLEQLKLSNKARFVEEVCDGQLVVSNRKKTVILDDLQKRGYDTFLEKSASEAVDSATNEEPTVNAEESAPEGTSTAKLAKGYDYLLGMKIWNLTFEKAEALRAERDAKKAELDTLEATSPEQLWLTDLDAVEAALDAREQALDVAASEEKEARAKSKHNQAVTRKKPSKKRKSKPSGSGNKDEAGKPKAKQSKT